MIVMKFGGTSIADASAVARVVNLIKTERNRKKIVVVSAISEATNILTKVAMLAAGHNWQQCKKILDPLKQRHLKIATDLISSKDLLTKTKKQVNDYFNLLDAKIKNMPQTADVAPIDFAQIVAYGELLSSTILHGVMLANNMENSLIDARQIIVTDNNYLKGKPNIELMLQKMPPLLTKHLNQGSIVLTQGFIASTKKGITTILEREGSDYSASLIGATMGADEIQIWTDVDGIRTADPKIVKNTKRIAHLSFDEAATISHFGAKIIHPLTLEPAVSRDIPVRILNSINPSPKKSSTLIKTKRSPKRQKIISIAYKEDVNIINIVPKCPTMKKEFLQKVLAFFEKNNINIYTIFNADNFVSLIVNQYEKFNTMADKLAKFAKINVEEDKVQVTVVSKGYSNSQHLIKIIRKTLNDYDIKIITAAGLSNNDLVLVVAKDQMTTIIQKLHQLFF